MYPLGRIVQLCEQVIPGAQISTAVCVTHILTIPTYVWTTYSVTVISWCNPGSSEVFHWHASVCFLNNFIILSFNAIEHLDRKKLNSFYIKRIWKLFRNQSLWPWQNRMSEVANVIHNVISSWLDFSRVWIFASWLTQPIRKLVVLYFGIKISLRDLFLICTVWAAHQSLSMSIEYK